MVGVALVVGLMRGCAGYLRSSTLKKRSSRTPIRVKQDALTYIRRLSPARRKAALRILKEISDQLQDSEEHSSTVSPTSSTKSTDKPSPRAICPLGATHLVFRLMPRESAGDISGEMGKLIEQGKADLQLAWLVAQLSRRGLGSLIPLILAGAHWEVEKGRLWVFVDGDRAASARPSHH